MNLSIWRHLAGLLLLSLLLLHSPGAQAQNVDCSASMTNLTFGSVDPQSSQTDANATLTYTCDNNSNRTYTARLCFNIGDGAQGAGQTNPRQMLDGSGDILTFQLYQDSARSQPWGSSGFGVFRTPYEATITITRWSSQSGTATMYGRVINGQTTAKPGSYQDDFHGVHTRLDYDVRNGNSPPASCNGYDGGTFGFNVTANVVNKCTVSATDVSFGAQPASAINVRATGAITVNCANGTTYDVGLRPSSANGGTDNGTGNLAGAAPGNTDKVPYKLYQDAGYSIPWGNTIGSNALGPKVGTGNAQNYPVRVEVQSANYTPDNYQDTVTVNVTY